ncbi:MAG: glycosyltransferase [Bacteroidia bacterium]|jgi:glycosyltransferase involved in cell wall biosynthesis|nr:glycosyltransferase [Bacteroidia bacterium]
MKGNLLVLTYWSYRDALVQTYTLPYVRVMKQYCTGKIYLVTLEQPQLPLSADERAAIKKQLATEGIVPVFLRYQPFGMAAAAGWAFKLLRLWWLVVSSGVKGIHTWCTPAGMIGVMLSRTTGKPLVADSFEPHAEPMVETGEWPANGRAFRTLFAWEKKLAHRARAIIALTQSMKAYSAEKYAMPQKPFYIKPALIDFEKLPAFTSAQRLAFRQQHGLDDKVVCVMAGKTGGLYYEQEVFEFFAACATHWGQKFHALLLSPTPESRLHQLAAAAAFPAAQMTVRFVPHKDVFEWMNAADFAFNPCRPVPSRRHGTSIKNSEYWACGLPVVLAANISDDSDLIAQHEMGAVLTRMENAEFQIAAEKISSLLHKPQELHSRIKQFAYQTRNMALAHNIYRDIYAND